ncbi:MAG TPA: Uma2 family endonuclease [Blastocatellia bacterium]|nr:Uma2 family endonuclease [Blastocatellia bacterium]
MSRKIEATVDDLYNVPENAKAEIVNGKLLLIGPTGWHPSYAASEIFVSLREYTRRSKSGRAVADNAAFVVDLPNRKSFSPYVAFYRGPDSGMKFFQGAPLFAVEVRSEGDYGPKAEKLIAQKRKDYFAAGTEVVWDVDLLSDDVVRVYRFSDPERPAIYRRGEFAEAEAVLPGWQFPVDSLFD